MALKETMKSLNNLIEAISKDLIKAEKGNKTAAQRVRVNTIKFSKKAKTYRKESIAAIKSSKKKPVAKKTKKRTKR
jgi:hypothetical protein